MLFFPAPPWYEMPQCNWCLLTHGWKWWSHVGLTPNILLFLSCTIIFPTKKTWHACTQPIANVLGMGTIQRTYGHLWTCSIWIWFSHLPIQHGWFSTAIFGLPEGEDWTHLSSQRDQTNAFHAGVVYPSLAGGETEAVVSSGWYRHCFHLVAMNLEVLTIRMFISRGLLGLKCHNYDLTSQLSQWQLVCLSFIRTYTNHFPHFSQIRPCLMIPEDIQ
jgi:hypothetical protein